MRNLKKVLSLALALVMLLGMMVVGAGAATEFQDADKIQNKEAVAVLVGMGIMKGRTNGSSDDVLFAPDGTLTRAEAAMMIAQMDLGVDAAAALVGNGSNTFSDVWAGYWAEGAIDYCVEQGYIKGDGAGHFLPGNPVSSVEFGSMALRLLGYDANNEGLVGDQWAVKAASLIRKAGLATSVAANTKPMTRDEMAQMAFNTLTAVTVEYNGFNFSGDNISFSSPATVRRHTGADVTGTDKTYDGKTIQSSITPIRFCEERFPTLKLDRSGENEFKEAYSVWTYRGVEIEDSKIALNCISTTKKEDKDDNSWMTNVKKLASGVKAYLNGKDITSKVTNVSYITNTLTKNGRLVEVYVNPDDLSEVEKVVAIDTALGEVTKVNSTTEKITIKLVKSDVTKSTPSLVTDKGYGEFKVGDLVLVQGINKTDPDAKFYYTSSTDYTKIMSVTAPQKVEGFATIRHNDTTTGKGKSIVLGGEEYKKAYAVELNSEGIDSVANFELSTSEDSTLYLDQYNYIVKAVGAKSYTAPADKLIAVSDVYQTLESGKLTAKVEGMLSDGTTVKWTWKGTEPDEGNIYTYVKDTNDGKYTLTRVKANVPTTDDSYVADVDKAFVFKSTDSRGQGNGSNLFYSDDVLFIFVEPDGTITKATGVQSYDNNGKKIPVVAQALRLEQGTDDHIEIRAVFIQAEPDVVDVNDIIYVHEKNANKNQVVEQKDGTNKVRYGYEAYNANAELIEEFLGNAKDQETYFIKKELNEDGSYVMNETNKFVFNQKYVASANGTSGNAFTLVVEKDSEWVDLVRSSNTKVVDLSDAGLNIENISELNKAVNEGRLVKVSVIWTRTYSDGTYDAKAVFVTDVGAIDSYDSAVIGSDPRGDDTTTEGAHKVDSITTGASEVEFNKVAVGDVPNSKTDADKLEDWGSFVNAEKDEIILIRAKNGSKLTPASSAKIYETGTYTEAGVVVSDINSNTGVLQFTMGEKNLTLTAVETDTPTVAAITIATDGSDWNVNAKLAAGSVAGEAGKTTNDYAKAAYLVDYLNNDTEGKKLGYTAKLDGLVKTGTGELDVDGLILVGADNIDIPVDKANIKVANNLVTAIVDEDVIVAGADTGIKDVDILKLAGLTTKANYYIRKSADSAKTTYSAIDYSVAANGGSVTDKDIFDTNEGNGYIKLLSTGGAVTVNVTKTGVTNGAITGTPTASLNAVTDANGFTTGTAATVETYVKPGANLVVKLVNSKDEKIKAGYDLKAKLQFAATAAATMNGEYTTDKVIAKADVDFNQTPGIELTFNVTAPTGALTAIEVVLTDAATAG